MQLNLMILDDYIYCAEFCYTVEFMAADVNTNVCFDPSNYFHSK